MADRTGPPGREPARVRPGPDWARFGTGLARPQGQDPRKVAGQVQGQGQGQGEGRGWWWWRRRRRRR
eukprot:3821283-Alexandrium_andersonii.AAC.1